IPPRPFGYGRARLAGSFVLFDVDASNLSWDVFALHHGLITAIQGYYLNEDLVAIDGSGFITAILNNNPIQLRPPVGPYGNSLVRIQTRLGLATETNYSLVTAALPTKWPSSCRGDGIASLMLMCQHQTGDTGPKFYTQTFPRGIPKPSVIADLKKIF